MESGSKLAGEISAWDRNRHFVRNFIQIPIPKFRIGSETPRFQNSARSRNQSFHVGSESEKEYRPAPLHTHKCQRRFEVNQEPKRLFGKLCLFGGSM